MEFRTLFLIEFPKLIKKRVFEKESLTCGLCLFSFPSQLDFIALCHLYGFLLCPWLGWAATYPPLNRASLQLRVCSILFIHLFIFYFFNLLSFLPVNFEIPT
jgi:hypothetical protein